MWSDEDLGPYLDQLGLTGIFDVHVHFMEPSILAKVWAYFDAAGPKLGRPWPITYRGTDAERVSQLRDLGVKRFSALSYAHKPGIAEFMNAWNRKFAVEVPESLHSATFYPEPGAAGYVRAEIEAGARVFKAHMQVGDFAADNPLLEPVWDVLAEAQVPTVLHAGSGPAPGEFTGPASVARVLARRPDLPLILAHLGMPEYDEFMDLAEQYENVWLDTTMVFVDFFDPLPDRVADRAGELGAKILFGSDFPNIPYPYAHQVEVLDRLGFGDDWMRAVLWNNASRLFSR